MVVRVLPKHEARVRFPYFAPTNMELPKKFLHDRAVLALITVVAALLVIGVSLVLLRFDVSKNPTTIVGYRPNVSGSAYQSGKPIDIYMMALFMIVTSVAAALIAAKTYTVRRDISIFMLASAAFLLVIATIVANALISLQ
jgi:hypothetical protein